jgi:tRNA G18 (ribose-2'-O)-methylase SpoU
VLENIRSTHNVGSILRTADSFGVIEVFFCGYTPYPLFSGDKRLPHLANKITKDIHKTALGAEKHMPFQTYENINDAIELLKTKGFIFASLEQSKNSQPLNQFNTNKDIALALGNEVKGVSKETLKASDVILEIPMFGKKESLNVSVSVAIALYSLKFNI